MGTPRMSTPAEIWKTWEGKIVDGKFPLRQWLGGSDHSVVFLTERSREPRKAAIKLISASNDADQQLSRWAAAAKLSHSHLLRLFESGRAQIDGRRLLYVVMEYAEEDLAQIIPLRPLSGAEATEMLSPTVEALASLLRDGFVHGRIQPSNIMAMDNQLKVSTDGLCHLGQRTIARAATSYDAPEFAKNGPSPASDVWSLGATLLAVLTQREPKLNAGKSGPVVIPENIPQPLREILRQCLVVDPQRRCTLAEIFHQSYPQSPIIVPPLATQKPEARPKNWLAVPIVVLALLIIALLIGRGFNHRPASPPAEVSSTRHAAPASTQPAETTVPPVSREPETTLHGVKKGSVLQQVNPEVSQNALNTITGRVKVSVQVEVDSSGNVSEAKLVSAGPSKYFANRALAAARGWKFDPAQVAGRAAASEWMLRFQFAKTSVQVFRAEIKP
jgi:TonB family protein